ncbi:class I SAM-dependent methyltransferase [Azospirillum sp. ST 5-10]|uniref:class I SAM-dependent methyltransferase n=1 Tax=unclassified Azospirillum TaxID=2630922 RepID=UPI003F4A14DB
MVSGVYPIKSTPCPLCGSHDHTPILSPWKLNIACGKHEIIDDLWVVVCSCCGFVFENPTIDVDKAPEYVASGYYASRNTLTHQNNFQSATAVQRWRYLRDLLPWQSMERIADVGALGPWAQLVKDNFPHLVSEVVEPSLDAVKFIEEHYPTLRPTASSFEKFQAEAGSYDLIGFFFSLYAITNPLEGLEKARNLLKPGGFLVIDISHQLLEVELWQEMGGRPYVDMDFLIQSILVSYFSRRTLKKALEYCGFTIEHEFVIPFPFDHDSRYRQELVVVARAQGQRPDGDRMDFFRNEGEAAWARRFLTEFCRDASSRSIAAWVAEAAPREVAIIWDDERYLAILKDLFQEHGLPVVAVRSLEEAERTVAPTTPILNAARTLIDHPKVINCTRGDDGSDKYPPVTIGWGGREVMTRAFLPLRHYPIEVFPFPRAVERPVP